MPFRVLVALMVFAIELPFNEDEPLVGVCWPFCRLLFFRLLGLRFWGWEFMVTFFLPWNYFRIKIRDILTENTNRSAFNWKQSLQWISIRLRSRTCTCSSDSPACASHVVVRPPFRMAYVRLYRDSSISFLLKRKGKATCWIIVHVC